MSVAAQRQAAKIVAVTLVLFIGVVAVIGWQAVRYPQTPMPGPAKEAKIIVERGTSLVEIARRLAERGLIRHPSWFRFYANERGLSQKLKAGQYTLSSAMTPAEILEHLIEGVPIEEVAVTIPEGKNLL